MSHVTFHRSDNAEQYRSNANFVYNDENTREVLKLLDAQPGEAILDVGCGSGELTAKICAVVTAGPHPVTSAEGIVYAIDKAETMIVAAKDKNASKGIHYDVCDGHDLLSWLQENNLMGKFDKVFSNAALQWMKESPSTVIQGMSAALKPSGRLALEMGGHLNVIGVRSSIHAAMKKRGFDVDKLDPWIFPTPESYSKRLREAGFEPSVAYLYPRLTPLPKETGLLGWLQTFAGPFINAINSESDRKDVLDEVLEEAKIDMYDEESNQWTLMYCRLRVQATKVNH